LTYFCSSLKSRIFFSLSSSITHYNNINQSSELPRKKYKMTSPCASSTEEFSPVHSSDEACSRRRLVFRCFCAFNPQFWPNFLKFRHPLRGKSSRTCSGNDELSYAGGCAGGSSSIEKAAIFEELGSSSSTTRMPTNGPIVASPFVLTLTATSETEQKKRTPTWSHQESMVFYEALKQVTKNSLSKKSTR
jgi:hypothetical protein